MGEVRICDNCGMLIVKRCMCGGVRDEMAFEGVSSNNRFMFGFMCVECEKITTVDISEDEFKEKCRLGDDFEGSVKTSLFDRCSHSQL